MLTDGSFFFTGWSRTLLTKSCEKTQAEPVPGNHRSATARRRSDGTTYWRSGPDSAADSRNKAGTVSAARIGPSRPPSASEPARYRRGRMPKPPQASRYATTTTGGAGATAPRRAWVVKTAGEQYMPTSATTRATASSASGRTPGRAPTDGRYLKSG